MTTNENCLMYDIIILFRNFFTMWSAHDAQLPSIPMQDTDFSPSRDNVIRADKIKARNSEI